MTIRLRVSAALLVLAAPLGALAQAPVLLHDVEPGATDSLPRNFTAAGEHMYFSAGINGVWNLWQTDGTPEGTRRVPGGDGMTVLGPFDDRGLVVGRSSDDAEWSLLVDGDPPELRPLEVEDPGGFARGGGWFEVAGRRVIVEERAAHRDKAPPLSLVLREVTPERVVTLVDIPVASDGLGGFLGASWVEGDTVVVQSESDPCAVVRLTVDPPGSAPERLDRCSQGQPVPVGDDRIALVGRGVVQWPGGDPDAAVVLAESGYALLAGDGGAWFLAGQNELWWTDGTVEGTERVAGSIYSAGGRLRRGADLLFVTHNGRTPHEIVLHRPGVGLATVLDVGSPAAPVTLPGALHAFGDALVFSARAPGVGSEPHALPGAFDVMFDAPDAGALDAGVPDAGGEDVGDVDADPRDADVRGDGALADGAQDGGDGASGGCAVSAPRPADHPLGLAMLMMFGVAAARRRGRTPPGRARRQASGRPLRVR